MSLNQKNFQLYGKKNNLFKNLKLDLITLGIPLLLMAGCGHEYTIEPERLPVAYVGKAYNQQLNISGGRVIPYSFEVETNFPSDMNISISPIDKNEADAYNNLKISGVPKYKGTFTIHVYAGFYASGDGNLDNTYEFVVK
ncbi:hypothetical protein [Acinetobacter pittii]|uniref:hypothetical protein n=1 Tax=Acinetobacter pittii TaxID=48296 RepID=UPI000A3C767A|nr:hypothetical protein [Acinetobacter pittii]MCZ1179789.1 hypothetical protein [Acinetobacter pittii]OTU23647.1 hypothetical protein CAT62_01360 [Acinetobacter pittii]OTU48450.1 hypothetical protein CAT36_18900 [Acinetobacter pittii]QDB83674.1 hypothetical protein APMS7_15545 [Acinetobacter pittii]QRF10184.1 hypothetical protein HRJ47_18720 [Acinetobacter pittii]